MATAFTFGDLHPGRTLHARVYTGTAHADTILAGLQARGLRAAVLAADRVASPFVLRAAALRALHNHAHGQMKTRALETELLYNLSPSHSITYAFKTFGANKDTAACLICMYDATAEQLAQLDSVVQGTPVPDVTAALDTMDELKKADLTKLYKIKPRDLKRLTLAEAIANILAVASYK